ncbi:MAG: S-adenosylmethionine synthase [Candidatus Uhrbacteria bacterium GW2011_GWF2_41_16]|uniref:Methionine adenosyltransferase n=2 Tax=Candidatus Uhriibacteriota TaxID=1752732 RepID=A0A0G0VFZ6_9BACT|nr:MAG: S-adenosylmethionine synthase [Candidatus Uhrbacteria bacterium GW2011_GWA2_41_10]KKR87591.1 MAG: S-adenosylmethionine synthase [Candidatus Uhrbacteria bacterium GW2011_GWC2_41_11]KKR98571.1 MAG: S-adenosylmethionine synthase [Candidatus Uhrbacteria bacterium GW2011_GWF2_41_16]
MSKAVESVMSGQSDKICDQIVDAIVDEYLRRDPESRVDLKVLGSHGMIMIGGEVNSRADFDLAGLAKMVYRDIGYTDDAEVFVNVEPLSEEMSSVVGAADTVVVHGYATRETREFLPLPLVYAHALARRMDDLRKTDPTFHWLGPDGKVQIVMEQKKVIAVTLLAQHAKDVLPRDVQARLLERVVSPIIGKDEEVQIFINPIGSFVTGGFQADTGMSGQKSSVDFYGGLIPHGDVGLSGKDPGKVERAGSYMARFVAKQLVKEGWADAILISLAYTLGRAEPVMIDVKASGLKRENASSLVNFVKKEYDFRPDAIVERLDLKKPCYRATAVYGHFGREGFPWEE